MDLKDIDFEGYLLKENEEILNLKHHIIRLINGTDISAFKLREIIKYITGE